MSDRKTAKNSDENGPDQGLLSALNEFSDRVQDLSYGFPIAMGWATLSGMMHLQELEDFANECGEIKEEKKGGKLFSSLLIQSQSTSQLRDGIRQPEFILNECQGSTFRP